MLSLNNSALLASSTGAALRRIVLDIGFHDFTRRGDIIRKVLANCIWVDRGSPWGDCLEWQGGNSGTPGRGRAKGRGHSYPRGTFDGCTCAVHRVVWITLNGFLSPKKQLDHLCKNRKCVIHCEPVTHKENQRRRDRARLLR